MNRNTTNNKASRIRKAIREGRPVPPAKLAWLAEHEQRVKGRAPVAAGGARADGGLANTGQATDVPPLSAIDEFAGSIGEPESRDPNRLTAQQAFGGERSAPAPFSAGDAASPPHAVPPSSTAPSAAHSAVDVPPLPVGGDIPSPANPETPATPLPSANPQKEAAVTTIVDMAAAAWKDSMERLRVLAGADKPMFSPEFVDKIWKPAAVRLGVKYLPDSMSGDLTDAITVVVPPATTVIATRRIAAIKKREGAAPAAVPPPADGELQTQAQRDTAPTGPASAGDIKQTIRRTETPKMADDAVF